MCMVYQNEKNNPSFFFFCLHYNLCQNFWILYEYCTIFFLKYYTEKS